MSAADNISLIQHYAEEVFNKGDLAAVDSYVDSSYLRHDPGLPFAVQGTDGIRQLVTGYRTAFPDFHLDCKAITADGDRVGVVWSASGTHRGDLMGIPPTGNSFNVDAIEIFRIADGKIAEQWVVVNNAGLFQQLGVAA